MSTIINRIRSHLKDKDSTHRRIVLGFLWVSAFVFIGKLAGAAKELLIAWQYGVSTTVDAYVFTLNFVSLPIGIWFSVLGAVLIPLLSQLRQTLPDELGRFRAELFGTTVLIGLGISVITYFGLFWFIKSGGSGLPESTANQALTMLPFLSLIIPFGFLIGLFSTILLSLEKHRNTLLESIPALVIIAVLLLPPDIIPEPLIWGTVAGFAMHMVSLAFPLYYTYEITKPKLSFRSPSWQQFWSRVGVVAAGQTLMSSTSIMDQLLLARLDEGAIATFGYANRIIAVIIGFGAMAIARSTLPVLANIKNKAGTSKTYSIIKMWSISIFFFGVLITLCLYFLSDSIVELIFQRGKFTSENAQQVTIIFKILSIQIPFYFLGSLYIQYIFVNQKKSSLFKTYIFSVLAKIITVLLIILINEITIETIAISGVIFIITWSVSTHYYSKAAIL